LETNLPVALRRRTRPWTAAEDQRLLGGIARFGVDSWQNVATFVGSGRNRAQCSQRWSRGLNPRISKKVWTPDEESQLEALVKEHGEKSWAKIASIMGNRSDVQCRYHYRQSLGKVEDDRIPLLQKSRLTASTNLFAEEAPQPEDDQPMTLLQSRVCASTPRISTVGRLLEPPAARVQWGVVGSDPDSLKLFLSHFQ
jgi:hypothetical protein